MDSFQKQLEEFTPRTTLRQNLRLFDPQDTPLALSSPGRRETSSPGKHEGLSLGKRNIRRTSLRKERKSEHDSRPSKRAHPGRVEDTKRRKPPKSHKEVDMLSLSAVGANVSSIRGVDQTYADISIGENSSMNESLDMEAVVVLHRLKGRPRKALSQVAESALDIASKTSISSSKSSSNKKRDSSVRDQTYGNISYSEESSFNESIQLKAAEIKQIRGRERKALRKSDFRMVELVEKTRMQLKKDGDGGASPQRKLSRKPGDPSLPLAEKTYGDLSMTSVNTSSDSFSISSNQFYQAKSERRRRVLPEADPLLPLLLSSDTRTSEKSPGKLSLAETTSFETKYSEISSPDNEGMETLPPEFPTKSSKRKLTDVSISKMSPKKNEERREKDVQVEASVIHPDESSVSESDFENSLHNAQASKRPKLSQRAPAIQLNMSSILKALKPKAIPVEVGAEANKIVSEEVQGKESLGKETVEVEHEGEHIVAGESERKVSDDLEQEQLGKSQASVAGESERKVSGDLEQEQLGKSQAFGMVQVLVSDEEVQASTDQNLLGNALTPPVNFRDTCESEKEQNTLKDSSQTVSDTRPLVFLSDSSESSEVSSNISSAISTLDKDFKDVLEVQLLKDSTNSLSFRQSPRKSLSTRDVSSPGKSFPRKEVVALPRNQSPDTPKNRAVDSPQQFIPHSAEGSPLSKSLTQEGKVSTTKTLLENESPLKDASRSPEERTSRKIAIGPSSPKRQTPGQNRESSPIGDASHSPKERTPRKIDVGSPRRQTPRKSRESFPIGDASHSPKKHTPRKIDIGSPRRQTPRKSRESFPIGDASHSPKERTPRKIDIGSPRRQTPRKSGENSPIRDESYSPKEHTPMKFSEGSLRRQTPRKSRESSPGTSSVPKSPDKSPKSHISHHSTGSPFKTQTLEKMALEMPGYQTPPKSVNPQEFETKGDDSEKDADAPLPTPLKSPESKSSPSKTLKWNKSMQSPRKLSLRSATPPSRKSAEKVALSTPRRSPRSDVRSLPSKFAPEKGERRSSGNITTSKESPQKDVYSSPEKSSPKKGVRIPTGNISIQTFEEVSPRKMSPKKVVDKSFTVSPGRLSLGRSSIDMSLKLNLSDEDAEVQRDSNIETNSTEDEGSSRVLRSSPSKTILQGTPERQRMSAASVHMVSVPKDYSRIKESDLEMSIVLPKRRNKQGVVAGAGRRKRSVVGSPSLYPAMKSIVLASDEVQVHPEEEIKAYRKAQALKLKMSTVDQPQGESGGEEHVDNRGGDIMLTGQLGEVDKEHEEDSDDMLTNQQRGEIEELEDSGDHTMLNDQQGGGEYQKDAGDYTILSNETSEGISVVGRSAHKGSILHKTSNLTAIRLAYLDDSKKSMTVSLSDLESSRKQETPHELSKNETHDKEGRRGKDVIQENIGRDVLKSNSEALDVEEAPVSVDTGKHSKTSSPSIQSLESPHADNIFKPEDVRTETFNAGATGVLAVEKSELSVEDEVTEDAVSTDGIGSVSMEENTDLNLDPKRVDSSLVSEPVLDKSKNLGTPGASSPSVTTKFAADVRYESDETSSDEDDDDDDDEHKINLIPVTIRRTQDEPVRQKTSEDTQKDNNFSAGSEKSIISSVDDQSTSKLDSTSKFRQMTMGEFLEKLTKKPLRPSMVTNVKESQQKAQNLFTEMQGSGTQPVQHPARGKPKLVKKRERQLPLSVPESVTKEIFSHFAKCKFSKEVLKEVFRSSEKFWENSTLDLINISQSRKGAVGITKEDVVRLMKRDGTINENKTLNALIEEYLPAEEWDIHIPTLYANRKVFPPK